MPYTTSPTPRSLVSLRPPPHSCSQPVDHFSVSRINLSMYVFARDLAYLSVSLDFRLFDKRFVLICSICRCSNTLPQSKREAHRSALRATARRAGSKVALRKRTKAQRCQSPLATVVRDGPPIALLIDMCAASRIVVVVVSHLDNLHDRRDHGPIILNIHLHGARGTIQPQMTRYVQSCCDSDS